MLVWSLSLMGLASTLIGLTPTYSRVGIWAPILLTVLRFFQGIAAGGEWGGAVLLAVEHSGGARRGFHGSWPQMGTPAGLLLSTGAFAVTSSLLPEPAFVGWGWRIPFLLSVVLVGIGLFIRLRVLESPSFAKMKDARRESRVPLLDVFREYPREVLVGMGIRFAQNLVFYIYTVFVLSYGEKTLGYPRSVMLRGVLIVSFLGLFATPFWSHLSDRIGRRPVLLAGGISSLLVAFPFFWLLDRGPAFVPIAMILAMNIGHDMMYGPMAATLAELFGTHVRYSGASLAYQLTSVVSGGVAPLIATLLLAKYGVGAVATYVVVCCAVTVLATLFLPETHRVQLDRTVAAHAS
jgi:MHS family shikimate/dehydroshikimate transporter-like MFS transporter